MLLVKNIIAMVPLILLVGCLTTTSAWKHTDNYDDSVLRRDTAYCNEYAEDKALEVQKVLNEKKNVEKQNIYIQTGDTPPIIPGAEDIFAIDQEQSKIDASVKERKENAFTNCMHLKGWYKEKSKSSHIDELGLF